MTQRMMALAYRSVTYGIITLSLGLVFASFIGWNLRAVSILDVVRGGDILAMAMIGFGCALHQDWNEHKQD